jgi:fimbrial chaperone protein
MEAAMFKTILGISSIAILFSTSVFASFEFTPIIASVTPSGAGVSTSFTVVNADDTKTPIQIAIYRREPTVDGKESYGADKDATDSFQIFPSQIILNPKEKRTIRVTYVGEPKITKELSFRIIAEEFPINVTDPKKAMSKAVMSIAILTKYVGSLYVTPPGSKDDVYITAEGADKTNSKMTVTMENKGTTHFVFSHPKVIVIDEKTKKEYPLPEDSMNAIGIQNILAGSTRKFVIPWPKSIPSGGPLKVAIEATKK